MSTTPNIWIVGTYHARLENSTVAWTYEGAFSSKELAIGRAKRLGGDSVFIAPTQMDIELPGEGVDWPGVEYPNQNAQT
jgi:hypothetical protein